MLRIITLVSALALCASASPCRAVDLADFRKDRVKNQRQIAALQDAVNAACGCTVAGISIGHTLDRSSWRLDFPSGVTPAQTKAATATVRTFAFPD